MTDHATKFLWTAIASLAGSITALSFRLWQKMTPLEVGMALVVGTSFAIFVTPLFISFWPNRLGSEDLMIRGGIYYLLASGWNILLPVMIMRVKRAIGNPDDGDTKP